jgi:Tol biopolymer transport system component
MRNQEVTQMKKENGTSVSRLMTCRNDDGRQRPWAKSAWALFWTLAGIVSTALVAVAQPLPVGEIVFVSDMGGDSDVYVISAIGGAPRLLIGGPDQDAWPSLSPDRKRIAFTRSAVQSPGSLQGDVHIYDRATGSVVVVTSDGDAHKTAWSPDGGRLAFDAYLGGLQIVDIVTGSRETLVADTFADRPSWVPDGSRIAYCLTDHSVPGAVTSDGLFVVDTATHASTMVLDFGFSPAVSPDGTRIAFSYDLDGDSDIFIVNVDGSGLVNLTADSPANEWGPTWAPNGRQIAFVTDRDGDSEIYRMDADGSNPVNLTNLPNSDETQPNWG